jgi:hypothetical protein
MADMCIARIRKIAVAAIAGASLALAEAATVVWAYPAAAAGAPPVLGHWTQAAPVPGLSALTTASSTVSAMSCAPSGDCAMAGTYQDALRNTQAWVASGHNGTWANATALIGVGTDGGGHSAINGVSCATGNYCVAVGETAPSQSSERATVTVAIGGTWQQAMLIPGLGGTSSEALSVACPSVGNCTVVGWYRDAANRRQAFVEDEVNGTWGEFQDLPDIARLNTGQFAELNSVSCGSPGNCTAAGEFTTPGGTSHAFFAPKVRGNWLAGQPIEVPPTTAPSTGRSVSCPPSGDCVLAGTGADASGHFRVYTVQVIGAGATRPQDLPGSQVLNAGGVALPNSVTCASAGNCVVVGHYTDATGRWQPFIGEQKGGTWLNASTVRGIAGLDAGHFAELQSVSCASPGNCAARGFYTDAGGSGQVLTTDEVNGTWGSAAKLPGQSSQGLFSTQSYVSCWTAGNCVNGGVVLAPTGLRAIVSVESPAASAGLSSSKGTVKFGHEQSARLTVTVKPRTGGTPAGKATIKAGKTIIAVVTIKRGKATWTLPPKKLRPGTYQLTARYASSNGYKSVTTAKKKLVVTK